MPVARAAAFPEREELTGVLAPAWAASGYASNHRALSEPNLIHAQATLEESWERQMDAALAEVMGLHRARPLQAERDWHRARLDKALRDAPDLKRKHAGSPKTTFASASEQMAPIQMSLKPADPIGCLRIALAPVIGFFAAAFAHRIVWRDDYDDNDSDMTDDDDDNDTSDFRGSTDSEERYRWPQG